jgi:SulP family sulfate permease
VLCLTTLATVAFDLIMAVEIGIAAAAVLALRHVARTAQVTPMSADELDRDRSASLLAQGILTYRLDGALFFGAAQWFLTELTAVTDARVVVLRLPDIQVLDATGAQALGEIVSELEDRGITVLLKGPRPEHLRVLAATGALDRLAHENHLFADLESALAHAEHHVDRASDHHHAEPSLT